MIIFRSTQFSCVFDKRKRPDAGFTLVEMLTVLAIVGFITAGFLMREQSFESSTQFTTISQETALVVRQAQTYGSAGRQDAGGVLAAPRYGVSFVKPNNLVRLFNDANKDGRVNDGNSGEIIETFQLPSGFSIDALCGRVQNGDSCANNPTYTEGERLNIFYTRPSPEASFAYKRSSGGWVNENSLDDTVIVRLQEADSTATSSIVVGKSGFIYVK